MSIDTNKCIKAVKECRRLEIKHFRKGIWCKEHNMDFEEMFHTKMERELRELAMKLEDILETGFVSVSE